MQSGTLARPSDTGQASRVEAGAAGSGRPAAAGYLDSVRTSVTGPKSLAGWRDEDEWWNAFEHCYHREMTEHLARWEKTARHSEYANARARTIALPPRQRMAACELRWRTVQCECQRLAVKVGCGFPLCERCHKRHLRRVRRRLIRACQMHTRARNGARGNARWRWVLLTLTVRHTGNLAEDRERIVTGWRKLRQWLHRRLGQFPFALAWEVTTGDDGKGHIHAHVAALWPWLDWSAVHEQWLRATDGASSHISVESARKGAGGAASYLAKYATKGARWHELHPEIAAKFVAATYGKRKLYASERFYRPRASCCQRCSAPWKSTETPKPLAAVAPGAVWASALRRAGVPLACGSPQVAAFAGAPMAQGP